MLPPIVLAFFAAAFASFAELDAPNKPPSKAELAAIAKRGKDLAGYDQAAWHASDAFQAKVPKPSGVARYIARKTDKGWMVSFGRLNESKSKFLIAYEATPSKGQAPNDFSVESFDPPKADAGFFLSSARAIETSLKDFTEHFEGRPRPYNVAVLPTSKNAYFVYLFPAPTKPNVWPLGGDVRYLVSDDGTKILEKRRLHKSVIEIEPPKDKDQQPVSGIHNHVLTDVPEDTDVFYVLARKPEMPEMISTKHFLFVVEIGGETKYVGKSDDVPKKK